MKQDWKEWMQIHKQYHEFINSKDLTIYYKELSKSIQNILSDFSLNEVQMVEKFVNQINRQPNFITSSNIRFNMNSVFIHGYKVSQNNSYPSGVKFDIDGKTVKKELADMIFILSYIFKGKKIFEKITFNQIKKAKQNKTSQSWLIDKEQLYLLSNFPEFEGVEGSIISNNKHYLNNHSKNLGSFGLIHKGDFIYSSAYLLKNNIPQNRKTLNFSDIQKIASSYSDNYLHSGYYYQKDWFNRFEDFIDNYPDFRYFMKDMHYFYHKYRSNGHISPFPPFGFLGANCSFSDSLIDFMKNYLYGNIGELMHNDLKQFMTLLFNNILASNNTDNTIKDFVNSYNQHDNFSNEFNQYDMKHFEFYGNIGIVYASVNLGERIE